MTVSWNDAVAFCEWLSRKEGKSYRLPTEAEWEYAARSGSTTRWHFGDDATELDEYAWHSKRGGLGTKPVGQLLPNAYGLFGTLGNVGEYCSDHFSLDYYALSPVTNPSGPFDDASGRVNRGGSNDVAPWAVRSAFRSELDQRSSSNHTGFRPVMLVDPETPTKPADQPPSEHPQPKPTPDPTDPSTWRWSEPINLGPLVNTDGAEIYPSISADGRTLVFHNREADLWMTTRASENADFGEPVPLEALNSEAPEGRPAIFDNQLAIIFSSNRAGTSDLYESRRDNINEPFGAPVSLGQLINTDEYSEAGPYVTPDGLKMVFHSNRPGSHTSFDLWICTRRTLDEGFGEPENLGKTVNESGNEQRGYISAKFSPTPSACRLTKKWRCPN